MLEKLLIETFRPNNVARLSKHDLVVYGKHLDYEVFYSVPELYFVEVSGEVWECDSHQDVVDFITSMERA